MEPITIDMGVQSNGCVYELRPESSERLRKIPGARPAKSIFITFGTRSEYESAGTSLLGQIVVLLTGLQPIALSKYGGVQFYDPRVRHYSPLRMDSAA